MKSLYESIFDIDDNIDAVEHVGKFGKKYSLSLGNISPYFASLSRIKHDIKFRKAFNEGKLKRLVKGMYVSEFATCMGDRFGSTFRNFIIFLENQTVENDTNLKQDILILRSRIEEADIMSDYLMDECTNYLNDDNCLYWTSSIISSSEFYILAHGGSPITIKAKKMY